jgi:hypothetical protein
MSNTYKGTAPHMGKDTMAGSAMSADALGAPANKMRGGGEHMGKETGSAKPSPSVAANYKGTAQGQGTTQVDPALGFEPGSMPLSHLGHFKAPAVVKAGHNTGPVKEPGGYQTPPATPTKEDPGLQTPPTATVEKPGYQTPAPTPVSSPAATTAKPPRFNMATNPIAATREKIKAGGVSRSGAKAMLKVARGERRSRNEAGYKKSDRAALKAAKRTKLV